MNIFDLVLEAVDEPSKTQQVAALCSCSGSNSCPECHGTGQRVIRELTEYFVYVDDLLLCAVMRKLQDMRLSHRQIWGTRLKNIVSELRQDRRVSGDAPDTPSGGGMTCRGELLDKLDRLADIAIRKEIPVKVGQVVAV